MEVVRVFFFCLGKLDAACLMNYVPSLYHMSFFEMTTGLRVKSNCT